MSDFFLKYFLDDCEECNHDLKSHGKRGCREYVTSICPADNMDVDEYPCECSAFKAHDEIHWDNEPDEGPECYCYEAEEDE